MIKIIRATEQPIESYTYWSYPAEELDYLLEKAEDDGADETYLYYEGRLYEAPYRDDDPMAYDDEPEHEPYIRSSANGDYSPSNPWGAPGMSVKDII